MPFDGTGNEVPLAVRVYQRAAEIVQRGWSQGALARRAPVQGPSDPQGYNPFNPLGAPIDFAVPTPPLSEHAESWCMLGALQVARKELNAKGFRMTDLKAVVKWDYGFNGIAIFNDQPLTRIDHVVGAFNRASARAWDRVKAKVAA